MLPTLGAACLCCKCSSGGKLVANLSFQWDGFSVSLNVDTSPVAWLRAVVQLSEGWRKGVSTIL
jgi:hypothetical protein